MYATLNQAILAAQTLNGVPIKCFYWDSGNKCTAICTERNEYGSCIGEWVCSDTGEPIPDDQNGLRSDCKMFREKLFTETLKTSKICIDNAYEQGCLPQDIRGVDKVKEVEDPNGNLDPNQEFSDSKIKNNSGVYVLSDGTYVIDLVKGLDYGLPIFSIDINGHKGPNKWGYDIYSFKLNGNNINGITSMTSLVYAVEKGGKSFGEMYEECFR